MNKPVHLFKSAYQRFKETNAHDLGAALAYFAVFSIIPLITVLILIAGYFVGNNLVQKEILSGLQSVLGNNSIGFLKDNLNSGPNSLNIVAKIIGAVVLVFTVITITTQLQGSLDKIFSEEKRKIPFLKILKEKITSFSIVFILAFFFLSFLLISSLLSFFQKKAGGLLPFTSFYSQFVDFFLTFLFAFGFSFINFKFLPKTKLKNSSIFWGSVVTSLFFIIGKSLLNLYLFYSDVTSTYGASGAVIILLLWVYYSSQILFFGASFSYAYEKLFSKPR